MNSTQGNDSGAGELPYFKHIFHLATSPPAFALYLHYGSTLCVVCVRVLPVDPLLPPFTILPFFHPKTLTTEGKRGHLELVVRSISRYRVDPVLEANFSTHPRLLSL